MPWVAYTLWITTEGRKEKIRPHQGWRGKKKRAVDKNPQEWRGKEPNPAMGGIRLERIITRTRSGRDMVAS